MANSQAGFLSGVRGILGLSLTGLSWLGQLGPMGLLFTGATITIPVEGMNPSSNVRITTNQNQRKM